ncbi:hypothetical protein AB1K32_07495 [Metabacillus dongyingensis]|uniref:hypothetical protein n=1 Tax=Metabacillus dongyingensis TaxID=2874282 RepID=UPI003B8C31AE
MMKIQNETVKIEKEFEGFGTLKLGVSTIIYAPNENAAEEKAILNLHELAIAQGYLTVMLNDGSVATLKVHNWELVNGVEAVYENEE